MPAGCSLGLRHSRRRLLGEIGETLGETACASLARAMASLNGERIRHSVVFDLRHPAGSEEEADFLAAAKRLAGIPCVEAFEVMREVSPKNSYRFGISMSSMTRRRMPPITTTRTTFVSWSSDGCPRFQTSSRATNATW